VTLLSFSLPLLQALNLPSTVEVACMNSPQSSVLAGSEGKTGKIV
jgi:hypothetical protein